MADKLLYGQIGGTLGAFIGGVHRKAIAIDEHSELVAGCFSQSRPSANAECAAHYGISPERTYADYKAMAEAEAARTEGRLDYVVICTPNNSHYDVAKAFLEKGFNVVCEKPLCFNSAEASELAALSREKNLLFCVTYTYTGYNMVKQAREMVQDGLIGKVVDVKGEYLQDWLIDQLSEDADESAAKLSVWRMDPAHSGASNCVGDIGSHIEATASYIIGSRVKRVAALLDRFGHSLDLNANMLVEFENGAHGTFSCSQIAAGHYNGLAIRIFGTLGAIEWEQEHPDFLKVTLKGQPTQIYTRAAHTSGHALELNRIPSGHPEGLTMAFANIYKTFAAALRKKNAGESLSGRWDLDFMNVEDGLSGVKFIEACVKSSSLDGAWVEL